jgi:molecular chaperone GrpE
MLEKNSSNEDFEEPVSDSEEIELNQNKLESKYESDKLLLAKLKESLTEQEQNLAKCQEKLKHSLADYQNLERKTKMDIENGVNFKIDKFMVKFLSIYDDFIRAKKVLSDQKIDISGLESIVKNMNALLSEYGVSPINALGEIFDPNYHEAVSVVEDSSLDDGTITKEIRKGYISQNRVIRPSIVEISKKSKLDNSKDEQND